MCDNLCPDTHEAYARMDKASFSKTDVEIKVFAIKDKMGKLDTFKVRIGNWEDEVPLRFLLISEISKLEGLLRRAYNAANQRP